MTITCVHSFCSKGIEGHWDAEEEKNKIHSCPQSLYIQSEALLYRSTLLAVLVEALKKSDLQAAPADLTEGP